MNGSDFSQNVYRVVSRIPKGRVITYGDVAALAGSPAAARQVGQIAHFGPQHLPWQRVVNKQGGLAKGYPGGGLYAHRDLLEADGVVVDEHFCVDIDNLRWVHDE